MQYFVFVLNHVSAFAGTALGAFLIGVVIDDVLGIAVAVKTGTFDHNKLPSFLASQFGTKEFLALLALLVTAYFTGAAYSPKASLPEALYSAATVGATAMTAAVLGDIRRKVMELIGLGTAAKQAYRAGGIVKT